MRKKNLVLILIFLFVFFVYLLSSPGPTPYDYFTRLAFAFLHKRLYLLQNPPWLSELVPVKGKYYVVSPPMPAVLLLPFVAIFGPNFSQTLFSILIGSLNVLLTFSLLEKLGVGERIKFWLSLLFAFGTNHWYLASVGSSWYLAHICAVFFLLLALNETFGKKRPFLIGLFVGAAYWSHLPTILSLSFFLPFLSKKRPTAIKFFLGIAVFLLLNFAYNFVRFGTIFDIGYRLIPGLLQEPWYSKGVFHPSYIGRNLRLLLFKTPIFQSKPPFLLPSWYGMSLFLTTPAFLLIFKADWCEKLVQLAWLATLLILFPLLLYGGEGWTQFGYRRAMDFTPFLLILTAKGIGKEIRWYHKSLIILSILVNLWGVLWINKFGWVSW